VQVVCFSRRGSRQFERLGLAHDEAQLEALKAAAQQRIAAEQLVRGLSLEPAAGGPLPITPSRMSHLVDSLVVGTGHGRAEGPRHQPRRLPRQQRGHRQTS